MDLHLVVHAPNGLGEDIVLSAPSDARVADVWTAVQDVHVGLGANGAAAAGAKSPAVVLRGYIPRLGRWLQGDERLGKVGLIQGDRALLSHQPGTTSQPLVEKEGRSAAAVVIVLRGSQAGRRFALSDGSYIIGRRNDADLVIPDEQTSGHHLDLSVQAGAIRITDLRSRNGTSLNGTRIGANVPIVVADGARVTLGQTELLILAPTGRRDSQAPAPTESGHVLLRPSPRLSHHVEPTLVELPAPPSEATARTVSLLAFAAPVGFGLVLAINLNQPWMLATALFSPLMAFVTVLEGRRSFARHARSYEAASTAKVQELQTASQADAAALLRDLPGPDEVLRRVRGHAPDIWQRRRNDEDFLRLRIGVARQPMRSTWRSAPGGNERLRQATDRALQNAAAAHAPVALDLRAFAAVGLCGDRFAVVEATRWLIMQAASHHSPLDVSIAAVADETSKGVWDSMKWLPHVRMQDKGSGISKLLASDAESSRELVGHLLSTLSSADSVGRSSELPAAAAVTVVLIDQASEHEPTLVDSLLRVARDGRLVTLVTAPERRALPAGLGAILEFTPSGGGVAFHDLLSAGRPRSGIRSDRLGERQFRQGALALAPLQDALISERAQLPTLVSLARLLEFRETTAESVASLWT